MRSRYITNYEENKAHPLLRYEDVLGYILIFKSTKNGIDNSERKSLKNYRNQITKNICMQCNRFPDGFEYDELVNVIDPELSAIMKTAVTKLKLIKLKKTCEGCRVLAVKQAYSRVIQEISD